MCVNKICMSAVRVRTMSPLCMLLITYVRFGGTAMWIGC